MKINRKYIAGIVVLIIAGTAGVYKYMDAKSKPVSNPNNSVKDDFMVITGSGTVKSANTFEVAPIVGGKITKLYFQEGDKVKANDLMFEVDSSDAEMNVEKLSNALEQAKLGLKNDLVQMGYLNIYAPISGQVSNILVKEGNVVSPGTNVLTITDRSKLKLTLQFNDAQIKRMKPGDRADVYINDTNQITTGTVSYINSNPSSNQADQVAKLFNVEILIDNPGTLKEGLYANATINSDSGKIPSSQNGVLSYLNSTVIQSLSAGQVEKINLKEDQFVDQGSILMTLTNNAVTAARDADNLKIQDLESQLKYAKKQLENYKIYAPMDGTILKQNKKSGEPVVAGEVVSSLVDLENLELVVDIDDADIANIKLGQKASVKFDALSDTTTKPMELVVTKLPIAGNILNGTTTYPVTLKIDNVAKIKIGMNANIEIKINKE